MTNSYGIYLESFRDLTELVIFRMPLLIVSLENAIVLLRYEFTATRMKVDCLIVDRVP